jgi:uncharacterized protein
MLPPDATLAGHYPGHAPIDAVGGGGFRFADMSHRGSLLIVPSGMYAWHPPVDVRSLSLDDFSAILAERGGFDFLLLGTGVRHVMPPAALLGALDAAGIGVDVMATRAGCRTYNVLLNEARSVAAALIAV